MIPQCFHRPPTERQQTETERVTRTGKNELFNQEKGGPNPIQCYNYWTRNDLQRKYSWSNPIQCYKTRNDMQRKNVDPTQSNVTIIQPENIYTTGIRLWKQSNRHFKVKATTQTNALECMHWLLERLQKYFTFLPDHFITRIIFLFHKQNHRWQWWWRFGRITSPMDSVQVGKAVFVKETWTNLGFKPRTFSYPGRYSYHWISSPCWFKNQKQCVLRK